MRLLIVTATWIEAERLIKDLQLREINPNFHSNKDFDTDLIITGVGIPATLFSMFVNIDLRTYDFIINVGIAGSFCEENKLGTLYNVNSDFFGDIGFSTNKGFLPVFESKFNDQFRNLINNGKIYNTSDYHSFFKDISKANGVTVNIPELKKYNDVDIETMEGAAFMLVCKHFKKNFIQIRGISNIIGRTNRDEWDFKTPIENYSELIVEFIKKG